MIINNLEGFVKEFSLLLQQELEWPQFLQQGRDMVSQLVSNPDWFKTTLSRLVLDQDFLKAQWQSIDSNDIQIYFSPDKSFSVRAYIWEPGVIYPIHDHGAWGIVGAHVNKICERKFVRVDNGSDFNYAKVELNSEAVLSPGETTFVLPINAGIHQMQAVDNKVAVSIHVYGSPIRKGYINSYNPNLNTVQRLYPPSTYKKMLAIKTLGSIPDSWSEEVLKSALGLSQPDYVIEECQEALKKIHS